MPGQVPPVADERDGLLAFLAQQRDVIKLTAYGLTDEQARADADAPSPLSVGGLIKHVRPSSGAGSTWSLPARPRRRGARTTTRTNFRLAARRDARGGVRPSTTRSRARPRRSSLRIADLGQAVPVPEGRAVVPRRRRRVVGAVGAAAPDRGDRAPRRPRRHRPRVDRRRHRVPAHGGGRGVAGDAVDAAVGEARQRVNVTAPRRRDARAGRRRAASGDRRRWCLRRGSRRRGGW